MHIENRKVRFLRGNYCQAVTAAGCFLNSIQSRFAQSV